jgi:hypothetical protein
MRARTGFFPYMLAAVWAALVVLALVDMAGFSATVAPLRPSARSSVAPQRPAAKTMAAPVGPARPAARSM